MYIPRALAILGEQEDAIRAWAEGWQQVPLHLLLPWASQMLSLLDAPEGAVLLPTLQVTNSPHSQHTFRA